MTWYLQDVATLGCVFALLFYVNHRFDRFEVVLRREQERLALRIKFRAPEPPPPPTPDVVADLPVAILLKG